LTIRAGYRHRSNTRGSMRSTRSQARRQGRIAPPSSGERPPQSRPPGKNSGRTAWPRSIFRDSRALAYDQECFATT
jgi:hypothetical protein